MINAYEFGFAAYLLFRLGKESVFRNPFTEADQSVERSYYFDGAADAEKALRAARSGDITSPEFNQSLQVVFSEEEPEGSSTTRTLQSQPSSSSLAATRNRPGQSQETHDRPNSAFLQWLRERGLLLVGRESRVEDRLLSLVQDDRVFHLLSGDQWPVDLPLTLLKEKGVGSDPCRGSSPKDGGVDSEVNSVNGEEAA